MLESVSHLNHVAREWNINPEDVLLIGLNASGARSPLNKPRMRFKLRLDSRPETPLFLILSLGREDSPFEVDESELRLGGVKVGEIDGIEDDDAVLGYWRNGTKMLTLNSNARSQCTGCVFCPNTLEDASDPKIKALDLSGYLGALAANSGMDSLDGVETVTICTGCFLYENLALEHLAEVRAAMEANRCTGTLHFLSSVLTSEDGLDAAAKLGPFHLTLTAECFTERRQILKESKAKLTPAEMTATLRRAKDRGIVTDFTYIVGLDPMNDALAHLRDFVPVTTTFPRFQTYQAHNAFMDVYRTPGSDTIEWHLDMRRGVEELFGPTGLRPQWWQNYRSPWCFTFAGEELEGAKV
ncbi:radical SAM protein [Streptomyces sp. TRM66268-LWL]|uniref:Radical SAM protein n=1 Tax=Streptomyces polyasparticus TaxID=2767826 RepID=A0ABR7SU81_9ACTN|nr:radical SAM protein [Streptomyces polyasparticus]MBC9718454.1 radical SAM protein [Streptomyces polyasparticus]